ncbi:MAG TPA: hypothetical protein VIL24_04985 [Clostridia bacterium]
MTSIRDIKNTAWLAYGNNVLRIMVFNIFAIFIIILASITIIGAIIIAPLALGMLLYYLRALRDSSASYTALFEFIMAQGFFKTLIRIIYLRVL